MAEIESVPTFTGDIVSGFLARIALRDSSVVKTDSFLADAAVEGSGVLTAEVTKVEQPTPGLPDYFVSVSVLGQTLASVDADKAIIRGMFDDAMKSVTNLTVENCNSSGTLPPLLSGGEVQGFFPVSNAAIREGGEKYMFTIDAKLAVTITAQP